MISFVDVLVSARSLTTSLVMPERWRTPILLFFEITCFKTVDPCLAQLYSKWAHRADTANSLRTGLGLKAATEILLLLMPAARIPCVASLALPTFGIAATFDRTDAAAIRTGHLLAFGALKECRVLFGYGVKFLNETQNLCCVLSCVVAILWNKAQSYAHGSIGTACLATAAAISLDANAAPQVGVVPSSTSVGMGWEVRPSARFVISSMIRKVIAQPSFLSRSVSSKADIIGGLTK